MANEDVKNYIISWNYRFPIDRWWRKKYNVPFNSSIHRESCFIDQLIEFEEDKLYNSFSNSEEYKPGIGDWLKTNNRSEEDTLRSMKEEFKEEFKDIYDE